MTNKFVINCLLDLIPINVHHRHTEVFEQMRNSTVNKQRKHTVIVSLLQRWHSLHQTTSVRIKHTHTHREINHSGFSNPKIKNKNTHVTHILTKYIYIQYLCACMYRQILMCTHKNNARSGEHT